MTTLFVDKEKLPQLKERSEFFLGMTAANKTTSKIPAAQPAGAVFDLDEDLHEADDLEGFDLSEEETVDDSAAAAELDDDDSNEFVDLESYLDEYGPLQVFHQGRLRFSQRVVGRICIPLLRVQLAPGRSADNRQECVGDVAGEHDELVHLVELLRLDGRQGILLRIDHALGSLTASLVKQYYLTVQPWDKRPMPSLSFSFFSELI